ncbi:MAG TPA: LytTR family DNA-binding domain-containing protein [Thermoanaerobaculia bacterium]|nr:LytTR family DNA-binding domain-containing protein [Thermoanaerobaculia bacterium]
MNYNDAALREIPQTPPSELIRAAIVDDERLSRRRIHTLLSAEPDIVVVDQFARVGDAIASLNRTPVDLLFLDVQMPRATGFEVLERLSPRPPAVIFATAHDEYALEAFHAAAIDYLLKPFDDERFRQSIQRARALLALHRGAAPIRTLTRADHPILRRIAVKSAGAVVFFRMEEIDWFETAGNYVRVHVRNASYLFRAALARLEEQLDPEQFVRINRSVIVNIDRIAKLMPSFGGDFVVELRDGTRLTLLAKYRQALQQAAGKF